MSLAFPLACFFINVINIFYFFCFCEFSREGEKVRVKKLKCGKIGDDEGSPYFATFCIVYENMQNLHRPKDR
jgi:hypothetical protein